MSQYGCHNKPRPTSLTTIPAQNGWRYNGSDVGTRDAKTVHVAHKMSTACVYGASDKAPADPRCAGCKHINQGAV